MGSAIVSLAGVLLGIIGTLATSRLTVGATERLAAKNRLEQRKHEVRQLVADAYVAAIEATEWLSPTHVEDSVDPHFMPSYEPKTVRAVESLRVARKAMNKAAALEGGTQMADLVTKTALALGVLDDAWHGAQEYRRKIVATSEGNSLTFYKRQFEKEWSRLITSRRALTGFDDSLLHRQEVDQGSLTPEGLLYQVRAASANSYES